MLITHINKWSLATPVDSRDGVKKYCPFWEAAIIILHKYGGITAAGWRRQDDPPRDDGWLLVSRCHPPSFQCQDSFERGPNMVCLVCYWSQHFLCSSLSQKASMFSTHWGLKMDPNMFGASVGPGLGPGHLYQSDIVRLCIMRISSDMWKLCEGVDKTKITKWHPARVRLTNKH